jgi:hypothetical protein
MNLLDKGLSITLMRLNFEESYFKIIENVKKRKIDLKMVIFWRYCITENHRGVKKW